jgi:hypothetical protein
VLLYGEFSHFHSYDLRKHKKNGDIAGGKLNQFNQFNGTSNGTLHGMGETLRATLHKP